MNAKNGFSLNSINLNVLTKLSKNVIELEKDVRHNEFNLVKIDLLETQLALVYSRVQNLEALIKEITIHQHEQNTPHGYVKNYSCPGDDTTSPTDGCYSKR